MKTIAIAENVYRIKDAEYKKLRDFEDSNKGNNEVEEFLREIRKKIQPVLVLDSVFYP